MKKSNRVVSFLLALTLVTGLMPADAFTFTAFAAEAITKPADGTSPSGEVFPTGVSENFRIPGLVNFKGDLLASADARWDYEKDGGGMDLVVSKSTDGGDTWNYTFAGYLGDNGNVWNKNSSTLMDPVIITDGETLYLVADMFPAGYSLNTGNTTNAFSNTAIGFNENGDLLLSKDNRSSYGYYLKDGKIYTTAGGEVSGYTVDSWFNLYENGTYVDNLFFANATFQVLDTSYICMMSSEDGVHWSEPTLLNVKPQGVSWMVLGPGSGIVTQDGYIAFTAYDGSNIYLIYGKDGEWNTVKTSAATNESSIIELNDGTIRAFVKNDDDAVYYVDFTKTETGYKPGSAVSTGVTSCSWCMVSSLYYSRTYNGKDVVLVCCPSVVDLRANGKIHAFALDESNNMELLGSYQINSSNAFFAYSNMAEMDDGTIALLYEDGCISYADGDKAGITYAQKASHITFTTVDLEEVLNVTFDASTKPCVTDPETHKEVKDLTIYTFAGVKTLNLAGFDANTQTANAESSNTGVMAAEISGTALMLTPVAEGNATVTVTISNTTAAAYARSTATAADSTTITLDVTVKATTEQDVELLVGETVTIQDNTGMYDTATTNPDASIVTMTLESKTETEEATYTVASELESGKQYLITFGNSIITSDTSTGYNDSWSSATGLLMTTSTTNQENHLWTITEAVGGYTIMNAAGKYLNVTTSNNSLNLSDTPVVLSVIDNGNTFTIHNNNYCLNNFGGSNVFASCWSGTTDPNAAWTLKKYSPAVVNSFTEITFTAGTVGTTTAKIGNVTYNITVKKAVEGNIASFTSIVGTKTYTQTDANNSVALTGKPITKLTISAGSTFASLGVDIANADAVIWSSKNTGIATVDQNGNVTGVAAGETEISAKVIKDGIAETISIPVHVIPSLIAADYTGITDESLSYVEAIHYVDVYFSLYTGAGYAQELKQVQTGEVIYFIRPVSVAYGMAWTSAPVDTEKYALSYMAATGTKGEYHPLLPVGHDESKKCFCTTQAFNNLTSQSIYGADETTVRAMLATAISNHCTGAMSQGRKINTVAESMVTSLTFAAERLPEVSKTLNGILPASRLAADFRRYAGERMTGEVNDYVYFTVSITQEAPTVWKMENGVVVTGTDSDGNTVQYSLLEFDAASLTDQITKGNSTQYYFYTKEQDADKDGFIDNVDDGSKMKDVAADLNAGWTEEQIEAGERVFEYYVVYTIVDADLALEFNSSTGEPIDQIENSVTLNYTYSAVNDLSEGTATGEVGAAAPLLVVGDYVGEFVADFGLPLIITVKGADGGFQFMDTTKDGWFSAKYGEVKFEWAEGKTTDTKDDDVFIITYIPTSVLHIADEVLLFRKDGDKTVVNSFSVVPATSVYYEDTLITPGGWTSNTENAAGLIQDPDILGDLDNSKEPIKKHPYGYDDVYATTNGPSNGTWLKSPVIPQNADENTVWPTATFSFTGTGVEIYANCTADTGAVMVEIWPDNGTEPLWTHLVDTKVSTGKTDATAGQTGEFYSLPIVSVTDLEHGSYVVKLIKVKDPDPMYESNPNANTPRTQGPVYIDGFRVFGTVKEVAGDSSLYYFDQEDHPDFYELRDHVLDKLEVQNLGDWADWYSMILGNQVFNDKDVANKDGVIIIDSNPYANANKEDLLLNGPKNELFLGAGQTLVFKVTTKRMMQIGLKAPKGATNLEITVNGTELSEITSIASSVDMFYELNSKPATETTYTVTITNTGSNILSVTKLKICDDPTAGFEPLTEEDVANVLVNQGVLPQRTYGDATVNVSLQDYAGKEVGTVTLSKHGTVGRKVTFTAAEILAAAEEQLPDGYAFVNKEAVFDVTGAYGESRTAYVQVGKVATVHITYISLSDRKVYTLTVTKIQFAAGACRISTTELMRYSPFGRMILLLSGITAQYGGETSVVVPVL